MPNRKDRVNALIESIFEVSHSYSLGKADLDSQWKDRLEGGKADDMHPSDFDPVQLADGTRVEVEHTKDVFLAMEIAMDHLAEDPGYYKKLKTVHRD